MGKYKPTHIIAHHSSDHNKKYTLYLGLEEDQDGNKKYYWEKDLFFDFDLILVFEKEMSKRNMLQSWPFPGYKWHGPGTFDYLVKDVELDEDGS